MTKLSNIGASLLALLAALSGGAPCAMAVTFTPSDPQALLLIDGRASPAATKFTFVKVDLYALKSENVTIKIIQGDDDIKYGDKKWREGRFFMAKAVTEGDYLLIESYLGNGGLISVESCYNRRSPLFHLNSGKINLIPRNILLGLLPNGAVTRKEYIAKILSEDARLDAIKAIGEYGTISGEVESLSPMGYYTLSQFDGSIKNCGTDGIITPSN